MIKIDKKRFKCIFIAFLGFIAVLQAIAPLSAYGTQYRIVFRVIGAVIAFLCFLYLFKTFEWIEKNKKTLASNLIRFLTLGEKLNKGFPLIGIAFIIGDLGFNFLSYGHISIGTFDTIIILLGTCFIAYNFIPQKFERERDFALLFLILATMILVIPMFINSTLMQDSPTPSKIVHYLLTKPLSTILNLIGIWSKGHGQDIHFMLNNGRVATLWIGESCTGIYSISLFLSAFIAFIVTEYKRVDNKLLVLLGLGVLTAYLANLLRMVIVCIVGYYYGMDALYWTHKEVGWMIFVGWVALFWWILLRYLVPKEVKNS